MDQSSLSRRSLLGVALVVPVLGLATTARAMRLPTPSPAQFPAAGPPQVAVLAGGCFWGIQGVFSHVKGVIRAVSGYAGGRTVNPTYDQVSSGTTGHAESVQITFDPSIVLFRELLEVFFVIHDPTTLNRQG
ncbi:MAG: peptide-methionine (S)-S-oxide reductase, partial [Alphaproteobacteria bacterium]